MLKNVRVEDALEYALLLKHDFRRFVEEMWSTIDPHPYESRWNTDAYCDHLQAVGDGEINRLIIAGAPGSGKSLTVPVLFPTWVWLRDPSCRFLTGTSRDDLTTRDCVRARDVIRSPFYQFILHTLYGLDAYVLKDDQDQKHKYFTNKLGWRVAFSTEGSITGDRGDIIALDDPIDIKKRDSQKQVEKLNKWIRSGMISRLDGWEKGKGSIIMCMQRLGVNDPINEMLKLGSWTYLKIPMEYRAAKAISTPWFKDPRTEEKELLPHLGKDEVRQMKREIGEFDWETQYNQEPRKLEGNIIHTNKFKRYDPEKPPKFYFKAQSWDTAFKTGQRNDYSVGIDFGVVIANDRLNYYIRNVYRKRVETPDLKRDIRILHKIYAPDDMFMEDKASGQALIPELQRYDGINVPLYIRPIKPVGDKVMRANSVAPVIDAGCVSVPEYADWLPDFLEECEDFPDGDHDDQVDAFTQGILEIMNNKNIMRRSLYE